MSNWERKRFTLELTGNQVNIILRALVNESSDDAIEFGEYSYGKCYDDVCKKLDKQGFWDSPEPNDCGE